MKRIIPCIVSSAIFLAGCGAPKLNRPPATEPPPIGQALPPEAQAPPPTSPTPDLTEATVRTLTRNQLRDGLTRLINGPGDPDAKLAAVFSQLGAKNFGPAALPFAKADLDGDGSEEYVMALPVVNPSRPDDQFPTGAALFVIYRRDGQWVVDCSEPMSPQAEVELMRPALHAVTDLAGTGHPQILWSRPEMIATGLQPTFFFVTAWQPGRFTDLPGAGAISNTRKDPVALAIEGKDLLLTGASRSQMFLPARTDRYRFVDGGFQLIDRRFVDSGNTGYDRFWDALVAEDVGRLADAEAGYRAAADPALKPHSGMVPRYNQFPLDLGPVELDAFGQALRTLARFRLEMLLNREAGCKTATAWAQSHPDFLAAFNRGVSDQPWDPGLLCSHPPL